MHSVSPINQGLVIISQTLQQVQRNLAFVWIVEIEKDQLSFSIVLKVCFGHILLVAVGVCQSCVVHEQVVGCPNPVHEVDGLILQIVVEIIAFV